MSGDGMVGKLLDAVAYRREHGPPLSAADERAIEMLADILVPIEPDP